MLTLVGELMPKLPPYERLKLIRKRAGFEYADDLRKAIPDYAHASSYSKYEDGSRGDKGIPYSAIRKIAKVVVPLGIPAKEVNELEVDGPTLGYTPEPPKSYTPEQPNSGQSTGLHFSASTHSTDQLLHIRANAEKGKFVEDNARTQDAGPGSIRPMHGGYLPVDAQFIVDVRDRHAEGLGYPAGTELHCCWPEQFTRSASLDGKRIVVWRPRKDKSGLGENLVATFKKEGKNGEWVGTDGEGQEVRGRPVAVVLQSLRPE